MCEFIFRVNNIVKFLNHFPLFGTYQGFPDDEIIEISEFSLSRKWQKKLLVQGFDSAINITNKLVEFCNQL